MPLILKPPQISLLQSLLSLRQTHTVAEVGRDLLLLASPTLLPKAVTYKQVVQNLTGSEYLQEWRPHNISVQLVPVFYLMVKKCFLVLRWNLLCFSLCPLPLLPVQDSEEPEIFIYIDKITPILFFSRLKSHSFLNISYEKRSIPLISHLILC